MDPNTYVICKHLKAAKQPEDVFGGLAGSTLEARLLVLKHVFNDMVVLVHPDKNPDVPDASAHIAKQLGVKLKGISFGKTANDKAWYGGG